MKRYRWFLIPIVLIIGLLLYFGPSFKTGKQSVDLKNANEIMKAVRDNTEKVNSYKYITDVNVGGQVKVAVTNRVIRADRLRQMADFSWDIPNMSGTASMYAEDKDLYIFHPLKDKWLLPEEEPTLSPFIDYFWKQLELIDPVANILKIEPGGNNISIVNEPVEGEPDTVAVQVIPRGKALSDISKSLPPQLKGASLKDIRQLFWISKKDLLVTRYEVRAKVAFFGIKTMNFKTVSRVRDYDSTEIKLPQPLVDKMKKK